MADVPLQVADRRSLDLLSKRSTWWLETELALLVLLVVVAYFSRMTDLTVRGEESRRGLIAREMLTTGDWIVPRCQGVPLFSRPPLQNWLIAGVGLIRGDVDIVAMRLPSDCAILLTVILIYGYARLFLTRLGALAAGAAYASMVQVLEIGRMGETDALFALFSSGSLLVWHMCQMRGDSPYKTWCLGYLLVALGTLTKGPQEPVYFVGGAGAYLLCTGQWRFALTRAHAAGIGLFALIYGGWQVPFMLKLGAEGAGQMYINDVGHRFLGASWFLFSAHLIEYPFEMLACLLPWSGLLIVWCNGRFRRTLGQARSYAVFLALSLFVAFPTVWLPPGSRPRYLMCLYPCFALLIGIVADRILRTRNSEAWRIVWPVFTRAFAVTIVGFALFLVVISLGDFKIWLKQVPVVAVLYALAALSVATLLWWLPKVQTPLRCRAALLAVAAFVALTNDAVMINAFQGTSVDTRGSVAEMKKRLPPGTKLVSFGQTHHMFAYHFGEHVAVVDLPKTADEARGIDYFCLNSLQAATEKLPFPWEKIATINCDKHAVQYVQWRIIVGRRRDEPATAANEKTEGATTRH